MASDTKQLAKDVLTMAADGSMPDTYWHTDGRILRACNVLGWSIIDARTWAEKNCVRNNR